MEYKDALVKTANAYDMDPKELHEALVKESAFYNAQELLQKAEQGVKNIGKSGENIANNLHKTTPGDLLTTKKTDILSKNVNEGIDKAKGAIKSYYGEESKEPAKQIASTTNKDKLKKFYEGATNKMPGGGKGLAAAGVGLGAAGLYGAKKIRDRNQKEEN